MNQSFPQPRPTNAAMPQHAPIAVGGLPVDSVIVTLEALVGCYQKLAKLAAIQHTHVQQGQTEALLDVLKNRQLVLDQISRHETMIGPTKRNWQRFAESIAPVKRQRADALLAETRRLLEEITTSDRNDVLVLQQRKLSLGKEINQATTARQVNRRYAAAAYSTSGSRMDVQQ